MTDDLDVSLRRRLESLASAVPVAQPGEVTAVIRQPVRARSTSRLALAGLLPVVAVVVIGAVVASVLKIGWGPGESSAGSTDAANGPIEATTQSGDFDLTIRSAKARYAVDEAIEIEASLTYLGAELELQIAHALGADDGPLGFGIDEPVVGDLRVAPATRDACARTILLPSVALTAAFAKSGGFSGDDPRAEEYRAFLLDPELRLTRGTWHVYAVARFSIGECGPDPIQMRADLAIVVDPGTASPAPAPSSDATEAPVQPSPEPPGDGLPIDVVSDGTFELTLQAASAIVPARQPVQLGASYRYLGPDASVDLAHFLEIEYRIEQLDEEGEVLHSILYDMACTERTLTRDVARTLPFEGWTLTLVRGLALPAGFDARLDENILELVQGRWRITASLHNWVGPCGSPEGEHHDLQALVEVDVVAGGGEPIDLATRPDPDGACLEALGGGVLARSSRTGLGFAGYLGGLDGDVIWPFGYSARIEDGFAVLVDRAGRIVAREGDPLRVGGGFIDDDDSVFAVCGVDPWAGTPLTLATSAEPETGCYLAFTRGLLARAGETGLGIADDADVVTPVRWPLGYTARVVHGNTSYDGVAVLFDADDSVVAWEGAPVGFSKAMDAGGTLAACQEVQRVLAIE